MSQENVEMFERAIAAYNARDVEGFVQAFDPTVEWRALNGVMFGTAETVYRGHDGVRQFLRETEEAFGEAQIESVEARDLGERIVVVGRIRVRGKVSGVEAESPLAWVADFEGGRVARMRDYVDPREALEAVGLSE